MIPRLEAVLQRVASAQARQRILESDRDDARARAVAAAQDVRAGDVALAAVRAARDVTTARVQQRLTDLASEALRVVFDDPGVSLEVRDVTRRGVAEVDLLLHRGDVITDPLEGNGGGLVADVAATLRLVMVKMLTRRGLVPLLVMDEPFAALSRGHRAAMADTLEEVARSLGIQVLIVTHSDEEARGAVYRVEWKDRDALEARVVREED